VHLYLLAGDDGEAITQSRQPARSRRRARPGRLRDRSAERDERGRAGLRYRLASARADRRNRESAGAAARGAARARRKRRFPATDPGQKVNEPRQRLAASEISTDPPLTPTKRCGSTRWRRSTASARRCARRLPDSATRSSTPARSRSLAGRRRRARGHARAIVARGGRARQSRQRRRSPARGDARQRLDSRTSNPRDLSEIAAAARERSERNSRRSFRPSDRDAPRPARRGNANHGEQPFRTEGAAKTSAAQKPSRMPSEADTARLRRIAAMWLEKRLDARI
jgi:hypothetical protein